MGTRHFIGVLKHGDWLVANYGQWDGYPSGQGRRVLEFCRGHLATDEGRAAFLDHLDWVYFATEDEISRAERAAGATGMWGMTTHEARGFWSANDGLLRCINRNLGADVLWFIEDGRWIKAADGTEVRGTLALADSRDFPGDSLFCEWAYVIDLDYHTLEVYAGFQRKPHNDGRFAHLLPLEGYGGGSYWPVRLVATWDLDNLPVLGELLALDEDEEGE